MIDNRTMDTKNLPLIVVVDDEPDLLDIYSYLFSDFARVVTYNSPQELLASLDNLEHEKVDILISDFMMPDMNGLEMIQTIRDRGHQFPTMLITAYLDGELREKAKESKCQRIIEKPSPPDVIYNTVLNLLDESREAA